MIPVFQPVQENGPPKNDGNRKAIEVPDTRHVQKVTENSARKCPRVFSPIKRSQQQTHVNTIGSYKTTNALESSAMIKKPPKLHPGAVTVLTDDCRNRGASLVKR